MLARTEPEDIAHQVAYLLGPKAAFVTNGVFTVESVKAFHA